MDSEILCHDVDWRERQSCRKAARSGMKRIADSRDKDAKGGDRGVLPFQVEAAGLKVGDA